MKKTLIVDFDLFENGHNVGFVGHILEYILRHNLSENFFFLFTKLGETILNEKIPDIGALNIYYPTINENKTIILDKGVFNRRQSEWKLILKYADKLNVNEINCLSIDQYFPSIILLGCQKEISGIYFRPSTRIYPDLTLFKTRISSFLKLYKKKTLEYLIFKRAKVCKLFILNDSWAVEKLNENFGRHFYYLPDPICNTTSVTTNIRLKYGIETNYTVFLIFGGISPRKNIGNILKAYSSILGSVRGKMVLLICGKVSNDYSVEFYKILDDTILNNIDLKIIVDDRFMSEEEMEGVFAESDVILIPYKDLYTSSGVLGTAAKHNKPCVVSNIGLLSELVDEYKLGVKVNPFSPEDIKRGMLLLLNNQSQIQINGELFCELHKPELFAKSLLSIKN